MKHWFLSHKKLHIWVLAELALLGAFLLARGNRAWMNALTDHVTGPLRRGLGELAYRVPFSVMELLYTLAGLCAIAYVVWSVIAVVRARGRRGRRAYAAALGAGGIVLGVYLLFSLLWGANFWRDSVQDRSGIRGRPVTVEDLTAVTAWFAEHLAAASAEVERDEAGRYAAPLDEVFAVSPTVYDRVEEEFPFLAFGDRVPKRMFYSKLMSAMGFTGVYCPFTGESNLNVDAPACFIPSTIAHELAHQRGVASEQECNFLAVLASTTCGHDAYRYSGWLMGYTHLSNALYQADREAWTLIRDRLPAEVVLDLAENNAYWTQYAGLTEQVSKTIYDAALKSYGDPAGIRSYGTVVDLLVAYYRDQI